MKAKKRKQEELEKQKIEEQAKRQQVCYTYAEGNFVAIYVRLLIVYGLYLILIIYV